AGLLTVSGLVGGWLVVGGWLFVNDRVGGRRDGGEPRPSTSSARRADQPERADQRSQPDHPDDDRHDEGAAYFGPGGDVGGERSAGLGVHDDDPEWLLGQLNTDRLLTRAGRRPLPPAEPLGWGVRYGFGAVFSRRGDLAAETDLGDRLVSHVGQVGVDVYRVRRADEDVGLAGIGADVEG